MITLPYLTSICISGKDAGQFLHNQLSADVLGLSDGQSTFACYCEPNGRVLALLLVNRKGASYYLIMSTSLAPSIARRLKIYVMRDKVGIEVLDAGSVAGVHVGDKPRQHPPLLVEATVPDSSDTLLIAADKAAFDSNVALQDAWKLAELQRGITWLCAETSGQFLPQMLGFDSLGAVNFHKGCYPGQEIVARTHYLGKVKRHPRRLFTATTICPDLLEKVEIYSADKPFDAIVVDCGQREDGGNCLFVVTRLDPDLAVEQIGYQGRIVSLMPS